jgi:hypothetical protein
MQSVIFTRSVISTRTRLVSTRRVCVLYTREKVWHVCMWFLHAHVISTRKRLISTRRVQFLHAECDFIGPHDGFMAQGPLVDCYILKKKKECDFTTHTRVILTRIRVKMTLTIVITTSTRVIYKRRVWFPHDCDFNTHESDFYTQSVIFTRMSVILTLTSVIATCNTHECDYNTHECNLNTNKIDFYTQRMVSTYTRLIDTYHLAKSWSHLV